MLNQQLITEWNLLKEKIINHLNQCQAQVQQGNHSQLQALETELQTQNQAIKDKEKEIHELKSENTKAISAGQSPEIFIQEQIQAINLHRELQQLTQTRQQLVNKLNQLFPLRTELVKLNRLYSLEQSLKERESENKDYCQRIERAETNWTNAEQKLDTIRDLLGTKQLNKLLSLYKRGQI